MRIQNNIAAMNSHRQLGITSGNGSKSMEKLSSGFRINRAGDDAAGLAISEKMRGQIRGLTQASRNAQDGISLIQTAEGALNETHAILQRMREITVQSQNDTNTNDDRAELDKEYQALSTEITRIGENTEFNKTTLLSGSLNSSIANIDASIKAGNGIVNITSNGAAAAAGYKLTVVGTKITLSNSAGTKTETINIGTKPAGFDTKSVNFASLGLSVEVNSALADMADKTFDVSAAGSLSLQIGANASQSMNIAISDMRSSALGGGTKLNATSIETKTNADIALGSLDTAINEVSAQRSQLGAFQNRLEHTIKNLDNTSENLQAAESRIRDVDMAKEMMTFTKNNILQQAAQAMLAQANQAPQGVLQLLR